MTLLGGDGRKNISDIGDSKFIRCLLYLLSSLWITAAIYYLNNSNLQLGSYRVG